MKISLMGYMGSGKTAVGEYLSKRIGLKFIDLDNLIEERAEMQVSEIFSKKGEIFFRKLENKILNEIISTENYVLSTGGGTPSFYNNLDVLTNNTLSIYLYASPSLLAERLRHEKSKRPLIAHIQDEDLPEFIAKHLFERNNFYQKAHHTITIQNKTVEEIGEEIILKIKTHQNLS